MSNNVIRELATKLTLEASSFNNSIKAVQREVKEWEKNLKASLTAAKDLGVGMAAIGTAAFGGMLVASKSAIDYADHLNDLRQRSGASVENLSKLGFAAEQSGSSMDGLAAGIKFLAKNMEGAVRGSKEQLAAFGTLGITARDLAASHGDVNKVFLTLADQFKKLPDGAGKSALAMQIFGKSGTDLIPVLNEGADGIRKLGADAERAGLVISQDFASASDALNDTLNEMKGSLLGASAGIAQALLPSLQSAASYALDGTQAFTRFIKEHEDLVKVTAAAAGGLAVVGTGLASLAVVVPKVTEGFLLLTAGLKPMAGALTALGESAGAASLGMSSLTLAISGIGVGVAAAALFKLTEAYKELREAQQSLIDAQGAAAKATGSMTEELKKRGIAVNANLGGDKMYLAALDAQVRASIEAEKAGRGLLEVGRGWNATLSDMTTEIIESIGPTIRFSDLEERQTKTLKEQSEELKRVTEYRADLKVKLDEANVAQAIQNATTLVATSNLSRLSDVLSGLSGAEEAAADSGLNLDMAIERALGSTKIYTDAQRAATGAVLAKNEADANAAELHDVLVRKQDELSKAAKRNAEEARKWRDVWSNAVGRAVSDFSRSVSDMLFEGKKFSDSMKNLFKDLGKSIVQILVTDAFTKVAHGLSGILGIGASGAGGGLAAIAGGGASAASAAAGGAGSVASSAGGLGKALGGATGALGAIGAIGSIGSMVSGIIGNFQNARMEGTMNAVEANTRFTYIELRDLMNLQMNPMLYYLERINTAVGGKGGTVSAAGSVSVSMPIEINQTFNLNGTQLDRQTIRDQVMPEMLDALETGVRGYTEKLTQIVKNRLQGVVSAQVPA